MSLPEPQNLGEFEILEKLGHGGMGAVYKARQSSLGRLVALKVLPGHLAGDGDFIARFKAEARSAAVLNHPGIVQVYAAGEDAGTHYFAMEFVDGESLQGRLKRKGQLDPREALAICAHIATALNYGWQKARIIHRDIKPDNIFLSRDGEVKLGDLGLAKSVGGDSRLTQTGASLGTPYYISPEQAHGDKEVDFRSDIYSLGCTLYHLVTGQTPYTASSPMAVMIKHITEPPPNIAHVWPECPPTLGPLLTRMLAKDPGARPQSYEQLITEIMAVHEQLGRPASSLPPTKKLPATSTVPRAQPKVAVAAKTKKTRRGISPLIYVAAGIVVVALITGVMLWAPGKKTAKIALPAATPDTKPSLTVPAPANSDGFIPLFNDRDLTGWEGDLKHWSVRDGAIVGQATPTNPTTDNTFLIWKGGTADDFILLASFILTEGNSGLQYRSRVIDARNWILGGYQLDMDKTKAEWRGAIYEERGTRGVLASVGERVRWRREGTKEILSKQNLQPSWRTDGWNALRITAQGNHIVHEVNGVTVADMIDEDPARQSFTGVIGLQLLKSTNLRVEFRDLLLKRLPPTATPRPSTSTPPPLAPASGTTTPASGRKTALFDGSNTNAWKRPDGQPCDWPLVNGALEVGLTNLATRENFQDFQLHAEFWVAQFPPNITGQARGNSGLYLQNRYEIQILDSFGLPPSDEGCGAIYKQRAPDRNACTAPETWQSYDITFRAARFDATGRKTANARITVVQNGLTLHNDVEIPNSSGAGAVESRDPGPIVLQSRNSRVRFRNIWVIPQ